MPLFKKHEQITGKEFNERISSSGDTVDVIGTIEDLSPVINKLVVPTKNGNWIFLAILVIRCHDGVQIGKNKTLKAFTHVVEKIMETSPDEFKALNSEQQQQVA